MPRVGSNPTLGNLIYFSLLLLLLFWGARTKPICSRGLRVSLLILVKRDTFIAYIVVEVVGSNPTIGIQGARNYRDLAQWKRVALITQRSQDRNLESRTGARKMPT